MSIRPKTTRSKPAPRWSFTGTLPTPATAHESVAFIQRDVTFGRLVHQAHFWGAQLLILVLMVRVIRSRMLTKSRYRRERNPVVFWASSVKW